MTPGLREVEDAALFSSQSISGEEPGIERFYSLKIVPRGKGGNVGDRDVCVCVCERKQKAGERW